MAARVPMDAEARMWQLVESAQNAVSRLRDLARNERCQSVVVAAVAIGRALGYAEALTFVNADAALAATASTQSLVVELERVEGTLS